MTTNIVLVPVPLNELLAQFRAIIKEEIKAEQKQESEKLISGSEACKLFDPAISIVTLVKWVKDGHLGNYRVGGRIYYKSSEIIEAGKTIKKYKRH